MNKTNIIVGAIAVVALIVGGIAFLRGPSSMTSPSVSSTQNYGNTSIDGSQSNLPNPSNSDYSVARLAFGYGTNLSNSNTGVGNIVIEGQKANFIATTSVICSIQNPTGATSSIEHVDFNIVVATSSSLALTVGTTTTQYATSSSMQAVTVAASATSTVVAWDGGSNNDVIGPGQYVNFGIGAASGATYAYTMTGNCEALFLTDN